MTTSRACCERAGRSSRRASSTSTAAVSAVSGERSSWLTSEAKRASRSMRSWTASAMLLNELTSRCRSGSASSGRRVSRPPSASSLAASATRDSGFRRRRLAHQPSPAEASTVTRGADGERGPDHAHRALQVGVREHLEVGGVVGGDVQPDGEVRVAAEVVALAPAVAEQHGVAQVLRDGVLAQAGALREPVAVEVHDGEAAAFGAHVVDDPAHVHLRVPQAVLDEPGVVERLAAGGRVPLLQQEAAGQRVGDERQPDGHDEAGDGEGDRDTRSQTEGEPAAASAGGGGSGAPGVPHALHLAEPAGGQERRAAGGEHDKDPEHEMTYPPGVSVRASTRTGPRCAWWGARGSRRPTNAA